MEEVNKNTELNDMDKKLHISDVIISFLKILMNILGVIIGIISLPFLFMGVIGWLLLCSLKFFGIPMDSDEDIYLSGPFKGLSKN